MNAGAPITRSFTFSVCKERGVPTWILSFLYVLGLVAQKSPVLQTVKMAAKDALLKPMFAAHSISQYNMSRFFTGDCDWSLFGQKRIERL